MGQNMNTTNTTTEEVKVAGSNNAPLPEFGRWRDVQRLFGINLEDLLTVDGRQCKPEEVYRKVAPVALKALAKVAALPDKEKKQAVQA